ncbi:MAG: DUF3859 domain-containing protein [Fibrobacterota bacterium]
MAKKKRRFSATTEYCGLFAKWSNRCSGLPRFLKFSQTIPARCESEFGYVLHLRNAKGTSVHYRVIHPPFCDRCGEVVPDFVGEIPVRTNDFFVYVGDTLWEPLVDKCGTWRFITTLLGEVVEDQSFSIIPDTGLYADIIDAHAREHL